VFTTDQIAHALFPSLDTAQKRLLKLLEADLVDRFRPLRVGGGSYPWRYLLAQTGLEMVAVARNDDVPRRDAARLRKRSLIRNQTYEHRAGVNQFFVDLAGHARIHPGASLDRWLSTKQSESPYAFGTLALSTVRPDGHGVWTEDGNTVAFYFEYDTGTETITELLDKLGRYDEHIRGRGPRWPVLFSLHSAARQQHLHDRLTGTRFAVPVATMARDVVRGAGLSPADGVWLNHGAGYIGHKRLIDLSAIADPPPPERIDTLRRRPGHRA
jgi:hypothetical protein